MKLLIKTSFILATLQVVGVSVCACVCVCMRVCVYICVSECVQFIIRVCVSGAYWRMRVCLILNHLITVCFPALIGASLLVANYLRELMGLCDCAGA